MRRRALVLGIGLWWALGSAALAQDQASPRSFLEILSSPPAVHAPAPPATQPVPDRLFGVEMEAEMEVRMLRPIYTRRATRDGRYVRTQVLWPLWLYERRDERRRVHLFPLYYYYRDVHRYGDVVDDESDWGVFPFLWGGKSTRDGDYFALFPVGGNLKGQLAKDEIRFALFPLWFQWRDQGHVSNSWLWPIFTLGHGGGKETFRLWPLYGRTVKAGTYNRRFYAWPFIYREEFDLHRAESGRRGMTWPFWTYEHSPARDYRSVFWPFFSVEDNYRGNYREVAAPWPFWVRRDGDSHKRQVWPLFTGFRNGDRETHHLLGPLIRYSKDTSKPGVVRSQTSVALVVREERIVWTDRDEQYLFSRVWPLFDYEQWPDGASRTNLLSLLWFRDADGFGYQYAPAYTLYHHERRPDGSRLSWALWNLYRHERTADRNEWRLGPLMRYAADYPEDARRFDLLGGLLGLGREAGQRQLRLAWLFNVPLGRRTAPPGGAQMAEQPEPLPVRVGT